MYILSVLPFESGSGPLVSLLLKITAIQTSLVFKLCEFVRGGPLGNARGNGLCRCHEKTRVNTCVNKSLVQALESCPSSVTPPANLSSYLLSWKFEVSWLTKRVLGQPKIGCNTPRAMYSYYGSEWPISVHLISKISRGSMPPDPPSLAYSCMHMHTTHVTPL